MCCPAASTAFATTAFSPTPNAASCYRCAAGSSLASTPPARSRTVTANPLRRAGTVLVAAGRCGSPSASAQRSCASTRRPLSPPDATPHPSSTTLAASARTALVRLVELSRPVQLIPAALSEAKTLRSSSPHRSPGSCPTPLSSSKGSQPLLTAFNQSDSKPIDPQPSSNGSLHIVVNASDSLCRLAAPLLGSPALQHLDIPRAPG